MENSLDFRGKNFAILIIDLWVITEFGSVIMYEMYLKLKEENDDKIIIIKNGEFYYTYDNDSYVINYLFRYKVISANNYDYVCFPYNSLDNIFNILNRECIGYFLYDNLIKDKSFGDSINYHNILLKYYDKKCKDDLINKICNLLNTKSIKELEIIYNGIN